MTQFNGVDLATYTTEQLLTMLRGQRRLLEEPCDIYERQAREDRCWDLQMAIAVHNARTRKRLDGLSEERLADIAAVIERSPVGGIDCRAVAIELLAEVRRLQGVVATLSPVVVPNDLLYSVARACESKAEWYRRDKGHDPEDVAALVRDADRLDELATQIDEIAARAAGER